MKKFLFLTVAVSLSFIFLSFTPAPEAGGIKWMSWKQMQEAQKVEKRKVFVDVYTSWCGWCKRMDATTFADATVTKYTNEKFYAVKFDAETRENIVFNGKTYKYVSQGYRGYNELAADILNGQMSYPTTVFIDENLKLLFPVPGFVEPDKFHTVLNYVGSNSYQSMSWDKFDADFNKEN